MSTQQHVLVVGAGIAGCSVAIALARRGIAVDVVERQTAWQFHSSGIFVYSNGLAAFDRLGLLAPMVDAGFVVPGGRNVYLDADGSPLVDTFYPTAGGGRIPAILGIKRAEMHRVLAAGLARLGVRVRLGTTVADVDLQPDHVAATLTDGTTVRCDLLVGADGIRSSVRERFRPDVRPEYSGFGVWRSVHLRPPALVDKFMLMADGKRIGIMPISADRLYVFGTVADPSNAWHDRATWPERMRAAFAEFGGPVRPFLDALDADAEILYTAVEEVRMPAPWHRGRVVLIGDAAHAATPFMGQGGAMAVEDAVELAAAIDGVRDDAALETALAAFGTRRAAMCRFVQDVSRRVGEAGAQRGPGMHAKKIAELRANGQAQVDAFYAELARLGAAG